MKKYYLIVEGEEEDEVFDSYEAAEEYAQYLCSCTKVGAEILYYSNPGDYEYDPDDDYELDYEIEERDE